MEQGVQSKALNEALKESGCYFYCILKQVSLEREIHLSEVQAELIFHDAVVVGIVRQNCFINDPVRLANLAAGTQAYRSISTEKPPGAKTYIQRMQKPMFTHFVLMYDGQMWDPLDPARPGAQGYEVVSYRVLR